MAGIIIVEDGSGVAGANSYQTLTECKDYFDCIGVDISTINDNQLTAGLITAASDLLEYCYEYKGQITHTDPVQPLQWPRTGLTDRKCQKVASNSIPDEIKKAQCELARSNAIARLAFSDNPTNQGAVKKNRLDVMEQQFHAAGTEVQTTAFQTVGQYVHKLLQPYINGSSRYQIQNQAVT